MRGELDAGKRIEPYHRNLKKKKRTPISVDKIEARLLAQGYKMDHRGGILFFTTRQIIPLIDF